MGTVRNGICARGTLIMIVALALACDQSEGDRRGGLGAGVTDPTATNPTGADSSAGGRGGSGGAGHLACTCPQGPAAPPSSEWTEMQPPVRVENFVGTDAFAMAPDDIYFAGYRRIMPTDNPRGVLLRWNRGCWTTELTSGEGSLTMRPSIHGTNAGTNPAGLFAAIGDEIYQRSPEGTWTTFDPTWKAQIVLEGHRELSLTRIRVVSPSELWATEINAILHYNSGTWTAYQLNVGEPGEGASIRMGFLDLWVLGPNAVWVAGGSDQVGSTMDPAFLHRFDGASWTSTTVAIYGVTSIWPFDDSIWFTAPGNFGDPDADGFFEPISIFRYDNSRPPLAFAAAGVAEQPQMNFSSLWARSATDIWASGQDVARFNGYGWSAVPGLPEGAAGINRNPVFVTGDSQSVWLVAPGPRFFRKAHD